MNALIGFWVTLMGLCVGSFLNVVVIRGLKGEQIVKGSSHCTTCDYQLKWYDNIPLISYILLKGKCRKCGKHISLQYPIVEALNGFGWLFIFIKNGLSVLSISYMLVLSCMIVISLVDLNIQEIPFFYVIIIGVAGLISTIANGTYKDSALAVAIMAIFLIIIAFVTSGRGIGGGDIKLEIALAILLGMKGVLSFYIGCVVLLIAYPILNKLNINGFETHKVPFGPYLCIGAYIMMIFGDPLLNIVKIWLFGAA